VLTLDEFAAREREYWKQALPSPIFGFGVAIGFLVGAVIVYQILYTDVSDHLPEYATLKAMGYSMRISSDHSRVSSLSSLGFVPGVLFSTGLYALAQSATLLLG